MQKPHKKQVQCKKAKNGNNTKMHKLYKKRDTNANNMKNKND